MFVDDLNVNFVGNIFDCAIRKWIPKQFPNKLVSSSELVIHNRVNLFELIEEVTKH